MLLEELPGQGADGQRRVRHRQRVALSTRLPAQPPRGQTGGACQRAIRLGAMENRRLIYAQASSYLEAMHSHQTDLFLDYALRVLTKGRRVRQILSKVKARIALKLELAPLHLQAALHSISLWERASKGGQGLNL